MTFLRKLSIVFVFLILLYALFGFVVVPFIIEAQMPSILSEQLGKPVLVGDIQLNPFTFSLTIRGFEIQEQDKTPLMGFQELFVDFQLSSLYQGAFTFEQVRLAVPYGLIIVRPDGLMNISDLTNPPSPGSTGDSRLLSSNTSEAGRIPAVDIDHLSIEQGIIEFRDELDSTPFVAHIVPIDIMLKNFSTRRGSVNSYAVTAEHEEGEILNWEGTLKLDPIRSEGKVSVKGMKLRTAWEYLQDIVKFEITDGTFNLGTDYRFEVDDDNHQVTLSSAEIHIKQLTLAGKGNSESLISIPSFDGEGMTVDVFKKQIEIPSVKSQDGRVIGWLNPNDVLNFQALLTLDDTQMGIPILSREDSSVSSESSTRHNQHEQPWSVLVGDFTIDNYAVDFEDRTLKNPVKLGLESIKFQAHDVSTDLTEPIDFALSMTVNETGNANVNGKVQVEPLLADVEVTLSQLDLRPFQPYVDPFVQVNLIDGVLALKGKTQYQGSSPDHPRISFQGQGGISSLALVDQGPSEKILAWDSLSVKKVALEVDPTILSIGEISLTKPLAKVLIGPDGALNVAKAFSPPQKLEVLAFEDQMDKEVQPKDKAVRTVPVKVDTVHIVNAAVEFSDLSIRPNVRVAVQDVTGTIEGLSTEQFKKAKVDLKGKVDQYAPIEIVGEINPLRKNMFTDLTFVFKDWDMTGVSAYSGKFAGYPITQGKLSFDLDYQVSENTLEGKSKIVFNQLHIGGPTGSPDAPSLPIPLAVALLKDRRGVIKIDVPIRGNLNDPEFSYWKAPFKSLGTFITKAATSPFSALGKILGVDAKRLQYIEFPLGSVELKEQEQEKLFTLARALNQRPDLRLEITGAADYQSDRFELANEKLQAQLRQIKLQEIQTSDPKGATKFDQVVVIGNEEVRLVQELFKEKFGEGAGSDLGTHSKSGTNQGGKEANGSTKGVQDSYRKENPDTPTLTFETMKQKLLESIHVDETDLRRLAQERAKIIRDHLILQGEISQERVFLTDVSFNPEKSEEAVRSTLALAAG